MTSKKNYCYLVCSVKDDLPAACCDNYYQIMEFLDCCQLTVVRMVKNHTPHKGYYIEKVIL